MLTGTTVGLESDDYRVVRTHAVGESRGLTVLILFKVDTPSYAEAFESLYAAAELPPDRAHALVHLVHERTKRNFVLFSLPRVTVRADVVEFVPAPGPSVESAPLAGESEVASPRNGER